MKVQIKKNGVYIPKWRDNQKLPEGEQIKFHYRFLTNDERDEFIYLEPVTLQQIDDNKALDRKYVQNGKGIAKLITTKIENFLADDGKEVEIKDIGTFYKYSFPLLAAEYESHLLNVSQVVESKNSQ